MLKNGVHKDGRDSSLVLELTTRCNMGCKSCYSLSSRNGEFIPDHILNPVLQYAHSDLKHVFLTGGEPTLDRRIFDLARQYRDIIFFIFTNSTMLTSEFAEKLGKAGNLIPFLSMNSSKRELHDHYKGQGNFRAVGNAIDVLNAHGVPWGFISMVTNRNIRDVMSRRFISEKKIRGAIIGRYIEYLPVGSAVNKADVLTGENYYFLETRKKEIIQSKEIYMQDTAQRKCAGLLFIDVYGMIRSCPFFYLFKHTADEGDIRDSVEETRRDWLSVSYEGECPLYSDPLGVKNQLEQKGWKPVTPASENFFDNRILRDYMRDQYRIFLDMKKAESA